MFIVAESKVVTESHVKLNFNTSESCIASIFFFSSRRRHTRFDCDWSSDVCSSDLMHHRLAPVLRALLLDVGEVLVEHDAVLAGERDEALAARPPDEREVRLARQ